MKAQTLYAQAGGMRTFTRLAKFFYAAVERDPVLRPLFPAKSELSRKKLAWFLAETFGGPKKYSAWRGPRTLQAMHAPFPIQPQHVRAWLAHMDQALDQVGLAPPVRRIIDSYFCEHARRVGDPLQPLYALPLADLKARLGGDAALAGKLLPAAARDDDLNHVQLLLDLGADVNAVTDLGHPAIYFSANRQSGGAAVAELLVRHGARVNFRSGPIRGTPLHAAARRDNVAVARILLSAGAEVDARDIKGETPLRRALNCRQPGMAALLVSHGANLDVPDRRGLTPRHYARERDIAIEGVRGF